MKSEADKRNIDEMVKVTTGFNTLKTELDKLDVSKTVSKNLKRSSDVVYKQVFKKTLYNTLVTKVNKLKENKFLVSLF